MPALRDILTTPADGRTLSPARMPGVVPARLMLGEGPKDPHGATPAIERVCVASKSFPWSPARFEAA